MQPPGKSQPQHQQLKLWGEKTLNITRLYAFLIRYSLKLIHIICYLICLWGTFHFLTHKKL